MPNISELKKLSAAFLLAGIFFAPVISADPTEKAANAVIDQFEQIAKPLFDYHEEQEKERTEGDPFFDKIREGNQKFFKKEQKRRTDFINKIRTKDWADEKMQNELANFQKKQLARRQKFTDKQQEKIKKYQEEGTRSWTELF